MTTSASTGVLLPDEAALRSIFDAEYPALLARARAELGEAHALAPRVVESAFAHAWLERAFVTSRDQLLATLGDDVQHGVARALSRRAAAHRFGEMRHSASHATSHATQAAPDDPEASWTRVLGAIHGHGADAHAAAARAAKHDAAAHVAQIAQPRSWKKPVLIGAAAVVAALLGMWTLDRLGAGQAAERAVNAPNARQHASNVGQLAVVTLDDGTRARLSADSRIAVPDGFGDRLRAIKLDGAATFEVAAGRSGTFQVFARRAVVTAQGTVFSVRAYEQDEAATITVASGTVRVRAGDAERELGAGAALVVGDDGTMREPTTVEVEEATAWMDGQLVIENRPLRLALPALRRWYGTDIKVIEPELLERPVRVRAATTATRDAIAQVEASGKLRFERTSAIMLFRDSADVAQAGAPATTPGSGKGGARRR